MTQKEFEERTQCAVKAETFAIINQLYMATDMDKDEFCREFKAMDDPKTGGSGDHSKKSAIVWGRWRP